MKILFYSDASGFGGHEIMAVRIAKELVQLGVGVSFACAEQNRRLAEECTKAGQVDLIRLSIRLNRFSFLTNFVDREHQGIVRRLIREIRPDCVVAVQGNIEVSSLGLLAAKKERTKTISYLAFSQTAASLGLPNAPVRGIVYRLYYSKPDRIVTISESQKRNLQERGVEESRIGVVENVVRADTVVRLEKEEARRRLGLEPETRYIGIIGRVVHQHKGHHYLVRAMEKHQEAFEGIEVLVVGDGEDLDKLKGMVARRNLKRKVRYFPWSDAMNVIYSALDAVVLPSNHEGVPLVMIEAVLHGLPVLASRIDGMRDYLPPEWLFPRGDIGEMAGRIAKIRNPDSSGLDRQVRQVQERFQSVFFRESLGREIMNEIRKTLLR